MFESLEWPQLTYTPIHPTNSQRRPFNVSDVIFIFSILTHSSSSGITGGDELIREFLGKPLWLGRKLLWTYRDNRHFGHPWFIHSHRDLDERKKREKKRYCAPGARNPTIAPSCQPRRYWKVVQRHLPVYFYTRHCVAPRTLQRIIHVAFIWIWSTRTQVSWVLTGAEIAPPFPTVLCLQGLLGFWQSTARISVYVPK